jgi:hypothetical protein
MHTHTYLHTHTYTLTFSNSHTHKDKAREGKRRNGKDRNTPPGMENERARVLHHCTVDPRRDLEASLSLSLSLWRELLQSRITWSISKDGGMKGWREWSPMLTPAPAETSSNCALPQSLSSQCHPRGSVLFASCLSSTHGLAFQMAPYIMHSFPPEPYERE